jgi:hypothetical protein
MNSKKIKCILVLFSIQLAQTRNMDQDLDICWWHGTECRNSNYFLFKLTKGSNFASNLVILISKQHSPKSTQNGP